MSGRRVTRSHAEQLYGLWKPLRVHRIAVQLYGLWKRGLGEEKMRALRDGGGGMDSEREGLGH